MQQLSGTDSFFLHTERGSVYNHVASLGIYDPSTAPEGKVRFKDILRYFSHRLDLSKVFRRRLIAAPHGIDRPYWIEDAEVDLEFHVRHIALPEPGDWRQLMIQVARLHSRPLDRSRPLWEAYVIEGLHRIQGLPTGSFAIFMKFHHAAIDGQAGAELLKAIHSLSAEIDPIDGEPRALYAEREPGTVELYSRAVGHTASRAVGSVTLYGRTLSKVAGLVAGEVARRTSFGPAAAAAVAMPSFVRAPKTRFNRRVSANRVVDAVALPLAAMKSLRAQVEGATINDIFLAVVGGALRRYLESKDELPQTSLMALMPISVRQSGQGPDAGNQVGGVPVAVCTDIADPVERLKAVRDGSAAAKRGSEALGNDFLKEVLDQLPNAAAEAFMRYAIYPQLNVTVSNVRGPDVPLYVAGARLVHFYPVSIATDYVGLNHTGFSYNGVLWICTVACRNMLPDPAFYSQCMQESFDELVVAVEKLPHPGAPRSAAGSRGKRKAAKPALKSASKPARRARPRRPAAAATPTAATR